MATIRLRNGKHQVQVRRQFQKPISKTFLHRKDAIKWGRKQEAEIERGEIVQRIDDTLTLGDLILRYRDTVTSHKRGEKQEAARLNLLRRQPIASIRVQGLTSTHIAEFRDQRIKDGVRTCRYDLMLLQHILKLAKLEWDVPLKDNPVQSVRKPPPPKPRERRLQPGEYEALQVAAGQGRTTYLWPITELALETAMRRGEILSARWGDLDLENRLLRLRDTKNGDDRTIPLTPTPGVFSSPPLR